MASCPLSFYDERVREMRQEIESAITHISDRLSNPMHLYALILKDVAGWFAEVPHNCDINERLCWRIEIATKKVLTKEYRRYLAQLLVTAVINCLDERMWKDYIQPDYQAG